MHRSLAPLLVLLAACTSSSDGGGASAAPIDAAGEPAPSLCANEPRAQTYHQGLEQLGTSAHFKVKLLDVTPNPVGQGDNRWNIALSDASGAPVGGATIALTPFLVDHGHASAVTPVVVADPLMGQYTVSKIDLALPGVWTFTFDVTAAGASDKVVFTFCIAE